MGFTVRIAPGVRMSAGRRGVRAGIGPEVARVTTESGRNGAPSGVAAVSAWHPVNGSAPHRLVPHLHSPPAATLACLHRQTRTAQRAEQISALVALERRIVRVHRQTFPVTAPPTPESVEVVREALVGAATHGFSWWQQGLRRVATEAAAAQAPGLVAERNHKAMAAYERLVGNDPTTVVASLEVAFEDHQRPAAPVDCHAGVATIVIVFDAESAVPDQMPARTPAGRLTLQPRTVSNRNHLYATALASTVLATVKEALAVACGLIEVRVVVVRKDVSLDAIYAGRFPASMVRAMDWETLDPIDGLVAAPDALFIRRGPAKQVVPLALNNEPKLRAVLEQLRQSL